MVIFHSYVSLPEGTGGYKTFADNMLLPYKFQWLQPVAERANQLCVDRRWLENEHAVFALKF